MDKNILPMVFLSSYILILINIFIVIFTIIIKLRDKINGYRYKKAYDEIYPYVEWFIKDESTYSRIVVYLKNKLKKRVVLDILIDYSKNNSKNIVDKFEKLGYIDGLIKSAKKKLTLENTKTLGLIKSKKAFQVLKNGLNTNDYELKYHCYYAISLLDLDEENIKTYISALLASGMIRDRIIEMINNLKLSSDAYVELLEQEQTEIGKVILLRVLENKLGLQDEKISDKFVDFLLDTKEVRIAAVITLASTNNNKYLDLFVTLYDKEEFWEVRAAIAKSMGRLSTSEDITLLKKMMYDPSWWVRVNAAEVLSRKGLEGVNTLIDISLSGEDDKVSDLAYYILNANQEVNKTMIHVKEVYNG